MVDNEKWLPASIRKILEEDPEFGVCIVFKNLQYKFWYCVKLSNCEFARQRISNIIEKNEYSDFEKEFIIFDKNGTVCYSNTNVKIDIDEFGIIHINGNEYLMKPFNEGSHKEYLFGKKEEDIFKQMLKLSSKRNKKYIEQLFQSSQKNSEAQRI